MFQLFEARTWTYTYLVADPETREAVLIDPVLETVDRDLQIVADLGLHLKFASKTMSLIFRFTVVHVGLCVFIFGKRSRFAKFV